MNQALEIEEQQLGPGDMLDPTALLLGRKYTLLSRGRQTLEEAKVLRKRSLEIQESIPNRDDASVCYFTLKWLSSCVSEVSGTARIIGKSIPEERGGCLATEVSRRLNNRLCQLLKAGSYVIFF